MIMSIILMTTLFYKALILQGEIWCWSILGLKGLMHFNFRKYRLSLPRKGFARSYLRILTRPSGTSFYFFSLITFLSNIWLLRLQIVVPLSSHWPHQGRKEYFLELHFLSPCITFKYLSPFFMEWTVTAHFVSRWFSLLVESCQTYL